MTLYQLRRLNVSYDPRTASPDDTVLLFQTTKIGRNPDLVDVVLISSVHSNMISREHTTIVVKPRPDCYACFIKDHSLNGTYVNDYRVAGDKMELKQGDVIKFGHVNGAAIKPGCYGPQTSAEFTFVFEEAPAHRLADRRRPITIVGGPRPPPDAIALSSQMFVGDGKSLHAASRLPLANASMEFASWQNPAAGAAAPFYNLQRFPGYYQAAFPQLSPAYLQSLWPQNPWPSPSPAAHQLQHQKQQVHTAAHYGQLTNPAWMGASAQLAADTATLIGAADNRLRTAAQPTPPPRVTSAAAAVQAAPLGCSQQASTATASATPSPSSHGQNLSNQGSQFLHSFAQRSIPTSLTAATSSSMPTDVRSIDTTVGSVTAAAAAVTSQQLESNFPLSSRATEVQRISRLTTECIPAQVIATPSAVDSVKRMECDSSVPSPPKSQATMFGAVQSGSVGIHRAAPASAQVQAPLSLATSASIAAVTVTNGDRMNTSGRATTSSNAFNLSATAPPAVVVGATAQAAPSPASTPHVPPTVVTAASAQERPMEDLQRENAERNSRMSGLVELTEDLLEDCGPPRRALSPASTLAEPSTATAASQQETMAKEQPKEKSPSRSPPHQSPKRRGHGHSDSSRSPTRTPIIAEKKAEPKKRRKNNEVAMLLNDLTEVAWSHLARKSTNKITAPTQTRKVYTNEDESSESESSDSEKPRKKKQKQKTAKSKAVTTAKSVTFSKSSDSGKGSGRKRGRPKKTSSSAESKGLAITSKKKTAVKKTSGSSSSNSSSTSSSSSNNGSNSNSDFESDKERRKKEMKTSPAPKDAPCTSAAEKIERALDMMRKRNTFPDSDDSSSAASFSSSSSPSPIRRTWGAPSQRKTGSAPGSSSVSKRKIGKTGRISRPVNRAPRKRSRKAATATTTAITTTSKRGRKKKNRSSSSESESSSESSVEWEKMKPVVTPLPAANAPLVFDEWTYHDPEKQCDARAGCKKPQSDNVDWVQCDYCNRWYHMECVADRGVTVDNADDFDCGCREANIKSS